MDNDHINESQNFDALPNLEKDKKDASENGGIEKNTDRFETKLKNNSGNSSKAKDLSDIKTNNEAELCIAEVSKLRF